MLLAWGLLPGIGAAQNATSESRPGDRRYISGRSDPNPAAILISRQVLGFTNASVTGQISSSAWFLVRPVLRQSELRNPSNALKVGVLF